MLKAIPSIDFFYGQNLHMHAALKYKIVPVTHQSDLRKSNSWVCDYELSPQNFISYTAFSTVT